MDVPRPSESDTLSAAVPRQRGSEARPPEASPAPAPAPPMAPRRRRLRRILLVALLVVGAGAVGAVGYGFIWYDQMTKPDRGTPTSSADSYLGALLIERDESRAALFVCGAADLDSIRDFKSEIEAQE